MSTLYLDHQHMSLELEGQSLVTRIAGERQRPIPLKLLERVVCLNAVSLDTHVLGALAEHGIAFTLANPRKPKQRAMLLGQGHNDISLRLLQYRLAQNSSWRLVFSRELLTGKLNAQRQVLATIQAARPDLRKPLFDAQQHIQTLMNAIPSTDSLASLLGVEGAAARAFFGAFAAALPDSLGFEGRKRRPPPDPVNASLSLAYTLLHNRAVQVIHAQGLEPLLGFFHEPSFGRESLASDLIEVWRPAIDEWVWDMFRQKILRAHHFHLSPQGCFLDKAGRQIFFAHIDKRMRALTRLLRRQTRHLVTSMQAWSLQHHA